MNKHRDSLFSVFASDSGAVYLYLDEMHAILDLAEEVGREIGGDVVDALKTKGEHYFIREHGADAYHRERENVEPTALRLVQMSPAEALDLAQDLIFCAKYSKQPQAKTLTVVE
jgi:hypothetical protein